MTFRIDDNFDVNNKVDEPKLEDFQNNQQGIILCIMPKPRNKKPNGKNLHMHNAQCTMHNAQCTIINTSLKTCRNIRQEHKQQNIVCTPLNERKIDF